MQEHYTKAVLALLSDDADQKRVDEVIAKLKDVLKAHGHERLLPGILRGVIKHLEHAPASELRIVLADATQRELQKYEREIEGTSFTTNTADAQLEADPNIIGGFKIRNGERMIDHSYKTQLLNLYRKIST